MGYFSETYGSAAPSGFTDQGETAPTYDQGEPFNYSGDQSEFRYDFEEQGFFDILGASAVESVLGPFVGLAEWVRLVDPGVRESMRNQYEETKAAYYGDDPSFGKKAIAAASYWGPLIATSAILPAASGAALSARLGVSRIVASGMIGAAEGAVTGFGDSAGQDFSDAVTMGVIGGAVGGAAGFGAGKFAARGARKAVQNTGAKIVNGAIEGGDALNLLTVGRKYAPKASSLRDNRISANQYLKSLRALEDNDEFADEFAEAILEIKSDLAMSEGANISLRDLDRNLGWAERVLNDVKSNKGKRVYDDLSTSRDGKMNFAPAEEAILDAERIVRKAVGVELKPVIGGEPSIGRGVRAYREASESQTGGKLRRVYNYFTDSSRGVGEKAMRSFEGGEGAIAKIERESDTMMRRVEASTRAWSESDEFLTSTGYKIDSSRRPDRSIVHLASDAIDKILQSGETGARNTDGYREFLQKQYNIPDELIRDTLYFRDGIDNVTGKLQRDILKPDIEEAIRRTSNEMAKNDSTISDVIDGQDVDTLREIVAGVAEEVGEDYTKDLNQVVEDIVLSLLETGDEYSVPPELLKDGFLNAIKLQAISNTLESGKGKYLTRTFKGFGGESIIADLQDPGGSWIDKMIATKPGRIAWNKAFDAARTAHPEIVDDRKIVEILRKQLMMKDDPLRNMNAGLFQTGANFGSLRPPKSHPQYISDLLQETTSGIDRARFTLSSLSSDLGHVEMLRKMYPEMIESGTLRKAGSATSSHPIKVVGASSDSPLSGMPWLKDSQGSPITLYATRDVGNLLNASKDRAGNALFLSINGAVHLSKTALSPGTHVRNFISAAGQTLAQGHVVNPRTLWEATALAHAGVRGRLPVEVADSAIRKATKRGFSNSKEEVFDMLLEIESRGVLGKSVNVGDIELFLEGAEEAMGSKLGPKSSKALRRMKEVATDWYQIEDNAHKVNLGIMEKKRFKKRLLSIGLDEKTANDVSRSMAADVVADSMMNYNRLPKAVQWARAQAVIGPFVSFPSEIIRNTSNTAGRIIREIRGKADDFTMEMFKRNGMNGDQIAMFLKSQRSIGMQRAAGLIGVSVGLGAAYEGMTSILTDDQAPPDALRELLPYWSENSSVHTMSFAPGEFVRYVDSSYLNPYATIIKPITALIHAIDNPYDESREKLMMRAFAEAAEPFVGPELIITEALTAVKNLNRVSEMTPEQKSKEIIYRFYKAFAPGVITSAERIGRAAGGNEYTSWAMPNWLKEELPSETFYGSKYELGPELSSVFLGQRSNTMDIPKAVLWRARDFKRAYNQSLSLISKVRNSTPAKRGRALIDANVSLRRNAEIVIRKIRAGIEMGLSQREIKRILNDSGVPKKFHRYIMKGDIDRIRIYETRRKRN